MSALQDWLTASPERQRDFAEERLIAEVAEEIWEAMEEAKLSKTDVAARLGKSKAFIGQVLNGSRNMTLRTLADIAFTLGRKVQVCLHEDRRVSHWQPIRPEAFVVQFRNPILFDGELHVSNGDHWQTLEGHKLGASVEQNAA